MDTSNVIALGLLFVTALGVVVNLIGSKPERQKAKLEQEKREEEKRIAMKANMDFYIRDPYLVAENMGPGKATDVHLQTTSAATGEKRAEELRQGGSVKILFGKDIDTMKATVHLTWKHPSGESDEKISSGSSLFKT